MVGEITEAGVIAGDGEKAEVGKKMRVSLVGAGPGDKGLLTLKGAQRIQEADVVLYDRFVSEEILAMIPEKAERINVGKNAGNHPVPQSKINQMLLEKAREGLNVVRLKGGDPFVFGRGGEELELLMENNIPYDVTPGVTSAIGGAAYAGIPVTHRDYASSLHLITGHAKNNEATDIDFDALVRAKGTLVFMMGVAAIGGICVGCMDAGMDRDTPGAIVENATTNLQRKFIGTLATLPSIAAENAVRSPALIIIGKVAALSASYDWFSLRPLHGKRVIVARASQGTSRLSERLRELGCHVTETPPAIVKALTGPGCPLEAALTKIKEYAWLVFTSAVGVDVFFGYLQERAIDVRTLWHVKIACVGTGTEQALQRNGVRAAYRPEQFNGDSLARGLAKTAQKGERLLIARAKDGAADLTDILAEAGLFFDDIVVYEKAYPSRNRTDEYAGANIGAISDAWADAGTGIDAEAGSMQDAGEGWAANTDTACATTMELVAFTSSSAIESFMEGKAGADLTRLKAVCIGKRTADTARSLGMEVHIANEATIDSMVDKIKEMI